MGVVYRPGFFCDVAVWIDGRLLQVTSDGPLVRCYLEDTLVWQQAAPEALLFCRGAVHQQLVFTIHQGQSGRCWLVGNGLVRDLGMTFGVQPVAIDSLYAYVVRSAYSYDRIDLESGAVDSLPSGAPGSSQGISDVLPQGVVWPEGDIWWADLHRSTVIAGETLTYPNVRGPVTVGQADPPRIVAAVDGKVYPVLFGDGYEPHVAVSGPRAAVCARTPQGAAYTVLDLPILTRVPGPMYHDTPEKKEEPKMSVPNLSAFVRSFLAPRLRNAGSMEATRRNSFAAVKECVVAMRQTDPKWGLLDKPAGDAVDGFAADIALYDLGDGTAQVVDIVSDAEGAGPEGKGDGVPSPSWGVKDIRPISQWRAPSGATSQPPVTPPTQPPAPPVDLSPLVAELAALRTWVREVEGALTGLSHTVDALQKHPALNVGGVQALIASTLTEYEVNGKTQRDALGLQHVVKLGITRKQ